MHMGIDISLFSRGKVAYIILNIIYTFYNKLVISDYKSRDYSFYYVIIFNYKQVAPSKLYNKANEGTAINNKIKLGVTVQAISINVPCINFSGIGFFEAWKWYKALLINHTTNTQTIINKNCISWCRSIKPCIIGVAGAWKPICHGVGASAKLIIGANSILKTKIFLKCIVLLMFILYKY